MAMSARPAAHPNSIAACKNELCTAVVGMHDSLRNPSSPIPNGPLLRISSLASRRRPSRISIESSKLVFDEQLGNAVLFFSCTVAATSRLLGAALATIDPDKV